jgi:hypothetical protein
MRHPIDRFRAGGASRLTAFLQLARQAAPRPATLALQRRASEPGRAGLTQALRIARGRSA